MSASGAARSPAFNRVEKLSAGGAVEPLCVTNQPSVVGHRGLLLRVQRNQEILRLRECKLGVTESGHGRESSGLVSRKRALRLVAIEQRVQMIDVHWHVVRVCWISDQHEP